MLAMDMFVPALPELPADLHTTVALSQATVAVFFAALAGSQLLWGELFTRLGPRRTVVLSTLALAATSVGCALAPSIDALLAMRAAQGFFAGASMVVVPSVIRATLPDSEAIRGIALVGMLESITPAAGPVLGTVLLAWTDWRGTFWVLAALALVLVPLLPRVTPAQLPSSARPAPAGYRVLLRNRTYVELVLAHGLCIAALLMFVASAPQLLRSVIGLGNEAFAAMQVVGVASFMLTVSQSGRIADQLGPPRAILLGGWMQIGASGALVGVSVLLEPSLWLVIACWALFCSGLAVRDPVTLATTLSVPNEQIGRASALMMLIMLCMGAAATQLVAPFLTQSFTPVAVSMLLLSVASLAIIVPWMRRPQQHGPAHEQRHCATAASQCNVSDPASGSRSSAS